MSEIVLAVIPGQNEGNRIVIAMQTDCPEQPVVVRQESYSDAVGWFAQSSVQMTSDQVAGLRNALGSCGSAATRRSNRSVARYEEAAPAVLAFQTAQAIPA